MTPAASTQTCAQSMARPMHLVNSWTSSSRKQAEAHSLHATAQSLHALMHDSYRSSSICNSCEVDVSRTAIRARAEHFYDRIACFPGVGKD
jgi:hypothetical protein